MGDGDGAVWVGVEVELAEDRFCEQGLGVVWFPVIGGAGVGEQV
jgi:hypothetical protein